MIQNIKIINSSNEILDKNDTTKEMLQIGIIIKKSS